MLFSLNSELWLQWTIRWRKLSPWSRPKYLSVIARNDWFLQSHANWTCSKEARWQISYSCGCWHMLFGVYSSCVPCSCCVYLRAIIVLLYLTEMWIFNPKHAEAPGNLSSYLMSFGIEHAVISCVFNEWVICRIRFLDIVGQSELWFQWAQL